MVRGGSINSPSNWGTKCTTVQWRMLSEYGAVFLPAAGKRNNTTPTEQGGWVKLWTSTPNGGSACSLIFSQGEEPKIDSRSFLDVGYSVRLAHIAR